MPAPGTRIHMPAEDLGPAGFYVAHYPLLGSCQAVRSPIRLPMSAENSSDRKRRFIDGRSHRDAVAALHDALPEHFPFLGAEQIQRTLRAPHMGTAYLHVALGRPNRPMTEKHLDGSNI